jgi:hypothetical protein
LRREETSQPLLSIGAQWGALVLPTAYFA